MNTKYLKWVILAGLFVVPLVPFFVSSSLFFPYITTKAFAWRIIVEIVFAAWIILALLDPIYRPKKSIILYSILAFLVIIGLADLFGESGSKSFWSNFERMEGFVSLLHLGGFFLVMSSVFDENLWKKWWNTMLGASFIMVIYCLFQLGGVLEIHQGSARVDGTFGNAAYLAIYMLINIFIALIYFVREKVKGLRITYGILIVCQLAILYYTATRGSILGLIGGLVLFALLNLFNKENPRMKKISLGTLIGIFVLVGGFYFMRNASFIKNSLVLGRFANISASELKTEGRSFIWPIAIQGIKEKPLLGWGQENFNYVFDEHYSPKMYALEPWFDRAHDIVLDWAIAGGLLGLLAYLSMFVALLYSIWKKDQVLSFVEKSLFTSLVAAYFFHNLFVFDHLLSYILFFAILAYIHTHTGKTNEAPKEISSQSVNYFGAPVMALLLIAVLYFVNIQPLQANTHLINALQIIQGGGADKSGALAEFKTAYSASRLGRPEVTEWIGTSAPTILQSSLSEADKKAYTDFAGQVIGGQADSVPTDARYQLLAGIYFTNIGDAPNAAKYLDRSEKLIPGKQLVYFEEGNLLINAKQYPQALAVFKKAYDMAPQYSEAQILYLVGAIYSGDDQLAKSLIAQISPDVLMKDDRIVSALVAKNRYADLTDIFIARIKADPKNPQNYLSLSVSFLRSGQKAKSIETLNLLKTNLPNYASQVDEFIKQINAGKI